MIDLIIIDTMKVIFKRLRKEEKLILFLLNKEYSPAEKILKKASEKTFRRFLDLLISHRISPIILLRVLDRFSNLLTNDMQQICKLTILRQKTVNILHKKEMIKASQLLSAAGYDVTLMKGLSYDPSEKITRTYGDIDLLIEEDKIIEIIALLQEKGYSYKGSFILSRHEIKDIESQLSWNNQFQFTCPKSNDTIEIHTNLFERDRIRLEDLSTLLNKPELFKTGRTWNEEFNCFVPSTEATLMLLCLHCSLKRSLYNNRFILRHMVDMEILFDRGINENLFLKLCAESQINYHAAFAIKLYEIIKETNLPNLYGKLEEQLTTKEKFLLKKHLNCIKNLRSSSMIGRLIFNFSAPFIIGGSRNQRLTWIRSIFFKTKVEQEHLYYRFLRIRKESPFIYLTYFLNPLRSFLRFIYKFVQGHK